MMIKKQKKMMMKMIILMNMIIMMRKEHGKIAFVVPGYRVGCNAVANNCVTRRLILDNPKHRRDKQRLVWFPGCHT